MAEKTRCGGRMTEAQYWAFLRSGLRRMSMKWRPIYQCLNDAKHPASAELKIAYPGTKYGYDCSMCGCEYPKKLVQVDHIEPCGGLTSGEELVHFITTLFCEKNNLRVLCKECHREVTQ